MFSTKTIIMKTNFFLTLLLCATLTWNCSAQKNQKTPKANQQSDQTETATPQQPTNTEECQVNMSLFYESAKNKNYADALSPWEEVYRDCPTMSKAIYIYGARIVNWQIEQETNAGKKSALVDKLMKLYDDQIKYFGNDERNPRGWILGMKAYYALLYRPEQKAKPYNWLKECITLLDTNADASFVQQYVSTSYELYKGGKHNVDVFINDYMVASRICNTNAQNGHPYAANFVELRKGLDALFVTSGAADCDKLESIYSNQIEAHGNDLEYLNSVIRFFKQIKCTESPTFFKASVKAYKLSPSYESAIGVASMYYKEKNYNKAISYFEEAIKQTPNNDEAADTYLKIAQVYMTINNYSKTREYAQLSLDKKANQCQPYLLIAYCYANSTISDDPVLNKTRFWVAVDMLQRAKEANSECNENINKLIASYRANFPKKDEIFMHPDLQLGGSYTVGGWIGRSTTVRAK